MPPKVNHGWTQGSIVDGSFQTVDLPIKDGAPVKIEVGEVDVAVNVSTSVAFYVADGEDDTAGESNIGDDNTRQLLHNAGVYSFVCAAKTQALYFTEAGGSGAVTDGLSYHKVKY
jgi:hypothetical protein